MSNELNEYLKEKGASTDLRAKRSIAVAFGLPFDNGTPEHESALLLALKVGTMANVGSVIEFLKIEAFNFDEKEVEEFSTISETNKRKIEIEQRQGWRCRVSKVITISQVI